MTVNAPAQAPPFGARPRRDQLRRRALAVALAVVAAVLVWGLAALVLGIDLTVGTGSGDAKQTVGAAAVAGSSLVAGLLGWALLALLERRTARAHTIWTAAATAVLLLSLGGPVAADADTSVKAVLVLLHLAVAAVLIPALRRTARVA